jgi:hypothetical protein
MVSAAAAYLKARAAQVSASALKARASYIGVVAGGTPLPMATNSAQQIMSSMPCAMKEDCPGIQIVFPGNWVSAATSGAEFTLAGTTTLTASIEYPVGSTPRRITFNGAASTSVFLSNVVSDPIIMGIPPKGATFIIHNWRSNPNGMIFTPRGGFSGSSAVRSAYGTTTPDLTLTTGGPASYQSDALCPHIAVIGQTSKASMMFLGDSRVAGAADTSDSALDIGIFARSIGAQFGYLNFGVSGQYLNHNIVGSTSARLSLLPYVSDVLMGYPINDIQFGGRSSAQIIADYATLIGRIKTLKPSARVWLATTSPANGNTGAQNTIMNSVNDAIRAGVSGAAGYFDLSDVVSTARNSDVWKGGYSGDGLHENQTGNLAIKNSGAINNALFSYP